MKTHIGAIKKILIAFLRPGHQSPSFAGGYTSRELLWRSVNLSKQEFNDCLRYLSSIGLVESHRGGFLSLNTKAKESPAREIAQAMLQVAYRIRVKRDLSSIGP